MKMMELEIDRKLITEVREGIVKGGTFRKFLPKRLIVFYCAERY